MSFVRSSSDTFIPSKRSAPSDCEPLRISRSRVAEDPYNRHLLIDTSPPPMATSTRRRVNPESLAVRLGPELVQELESYVKPGEIEMPSFAIRQQIQMRHKVDRRHIYDWFHSKGLRVTKEDKRATVEQKTGAMRMQRQIRRAIAPAVPTPCPSLSDGVTDSAPSSPALLTPPVVSVEFHPPAVAREKVPAMSSLDHHGAVRRRPDSSSLIGSVRHQSSLTATQTLRHMASTQEHPPHPPAGYSRKFREPEIDTIFALNGNDILNPQQRESYYNVLSRVLGPAEGVQECVGTYMAHMARQREIYYGDFLSGSLNSSLGGSDGTLGLAIQPLHIQAMPSVLDADPSLQEEELVLLEALDAIFNLPTFSAAPEDHGDTIACHSPDDQPALVSLGCLGVDNLLTSPVVVAQEIPQTKTVTFAAENKTVLASRSSGYLSPLVLPAFASSSSSLAGALGDCSAALARMSEQAARRKSKDWVRPQMGRARAYSGGGGM
ncbi:hypothetical protein PYCCODRAFT_1464831 [Trametes coccinea BRFM310]|uniref:Uncharacterized protein n=1 Tax=Trametes coccinea (strain BRFM310) TaxID=1353009 RepID=A0A1Y2IYC9_TRAC3|nr:hypothetical protein PYCCODRAFT_1464831 [Trametes coccinea BRFM310]